MNKSNNNGINYIHFAIASYSKHNKETRIEPCKVPLEL